jgi:hypothetical protein
MFTTGLYFTVFLSSCYIIISMLAPWFLLEEYLQIVASGTQGFFFLRNARRNCCAVAIHWYLHGQMAERVETRGSYVEWLWSL